MCSELQEVIGIIQNGKNQKKDKSNRLTTVRIIQNTSKIKKIKMGHFTIL